MVLGAGKVLSCRIEDVAIAHVYAQLSMITDGSMARAGAEIGGRALTSMNATSATSDV